MKMETEPDYMQMEVKNPRIGKVLKLEEEAKRQNELEQLRSKRIRQQQEYINQRSTPWKQIAEEYKRRTEAK